MRIRFFAVLCIVLTGCGAVAPPADPIETPPGGGLERAGNAVGLTRCAANQVLQSDGTRWACADLAAPGQVSVTAGAGVTATPNPITGTGTLAIDDAIVARLDRENTFRQTQRVTPSAATAGLVVEGATGQTANLQEWRSATGLLASVNAAGELNGSGAGLTQVPAGALTGAVAVSRGGTGADLSSTGPGLVRQASAGAALTVSPLMAADLPPHTHAASALTGVLPPANGGTGADLGAVAGFVRSDGAGNLACAPLAAGDLPAHAHDTSQLTAGTLAIARGGTNAGTIGSTGSVAYSDGTQYQFSPVGSVGQVLGSGGTGAPGWVGASAHTHSAVDLTAGTLPSARVSGNYAGITGVGTLGSLDVSGDVTFGGPGYSPVAASAKIRIAFVNVFSSGACGNQRGESFTCTRPSTGTYRVTFSAPSVAFMNPMLTVAGSAGTGAVVTAIGGNFFEYTTFLTTTGALLNTGVYALVAFGY